MTDLERVELALRRTIAKHQPYAGDRPPYYVALCDLAEELIKVIKSKESAS